MSGKPTITDLAATSGLGVATVDRVLHGRANVSARARQAVIEAAQRLGYPLPDALRPATPMDGPPIPLGFVLHKQGQAFYKAFAAELEAACAASPLPLQPQIRFAASQSPEDFIKEIKALAEHCQAIAATAVNHASLTTLTQDLMGAGIPVFSMLNDFAGSHGAGYFGMDNLKVGRLAGWMMATRIQKPATVGVFVGGARWHGQALRETGFRAALREHAPNIRVLDTAVNLETRQLTYEATLELLTRVPDLAGLYVAGGGMEGAITALREARPAGRLTLIVNELTPESRAALADRTVTMVLATPLKSLCESLVAAMALHIWEKGQRHPAPPRFEPLISLPESV